MAHMGSYRYDIPRQTTSWSDGVFAIHDLPADGGVPDGEIMNSFPEPDRSAFLEAVTRTLDTGEPFEMDANLVTAKGNHRRVRCSCEIELAKGQPVALIGLIQDITERHGLEQRLRHQAMIDDLTQLPNRAEFHRVLDKRLRDARAKGGDLAVLLIDLDGFKGVNDALGHAAGDEVLRLVADRLRLHCGDGCYPARLGGDEFGVVGPLGWGPRELEPVVRRLLHALEIVADGQGHLARVGGNDRDRVVRRRVARPSQTPASCRCRALRSQANEKGNGAVLPGRAGPAEGRLSRPFIVTIKPCHSRSWRDHWSSQRSVRSSDNG